MAKLVAKRYAQALFDLAIENNELEILEQQLTEIFKIISNDKEFIGLINHPNISFNEKISIMNNIFKDKVSETFLGLLQIVFKKNRETELLDIIHIFLEKAKEHKGLLTAIVTSAIELSDEKAEEIKSKLSKITNKQVEIKKIVDKALIGGMHIEIDGYVIDGTIKNQMANMKNQLLNLQLAQ